jgi:hypothetical protein
MGAQKKQKPKAKRVRAAGGEQLRPLIQRPTQGKRFTRQQVRAAVKELAEETA